VCSIFVLLLSHVSLFRHFCVWGHCGCVFGCVMFVLVRRLLGLACIFHVAVV
jgi:hypothetical protein